MASGMYPQYQQYQQYPATPSASAVNIQIFSPTANAAPQVSQQQAVAPLYQEASLYNTQGQTPAVSYPINYNNPIKQASAYNYNSVSEQNESEKQSISGTKQEDEKKTEKKKKEKVILTDDYIKSLENYLNNEDPKIRLTAAKELLERFKEDDTRKNDPALCALLNKVIKDPKASVRYIGLTILDVGYAGGNNETVQILKQLENRTDLEYGEDSVLASQILLKMSGQKVQVPDTNSEAAK